MASLKDGVKAYEPTKRKCLECGKLVSDYKSKRCRQCYNLYILNPKKCIECGKQLKDFRAKVCRSCFKLYFYSPILIRFGIYNAKWKGDLVGYSALHQWIRKNKKLSKYCEKCNKKSKVQAANISGKYKRDVNDYIWLCPRCHIFLDGTINNLNNRRLNKK